MKLWQKTGLAGLASCLLGVVAGYLSSLASETGGIGFILFNLVFFVESIGFSLLILTPFTALKYSGQQEELITDHELENYNAGVRGLFSRGWQQFFTPYPAQQTTILCEQTSLGATPFYLPTYVTMRHLEANAALPNVGINQSAQTKTNKINP